MRVIETQFDVAVATNERGIVVKRSWQKHLLTFLMVFGPGLAIRN